MTNITVWVRDSVRIRISGFGEHICLNYSTV